MTTLRQAVIGAALAGALNSAGAEHAGWTVGHNADGYGTILRSADSGATWVRQGAGQIADVPLTGVSAVAPGTAWVVGDAEGGYATLYHTTDGGGTWVRKGSPGTGAPDYVPDVSLGKVHAVDDNNVWAVGNGAILHTSDGGATWTNQLPAGYEGISLQGVYTPDGTAVWVTGGNKDGYATILKSGDGGLSWTRQSGGDVTAADHLLGVSAAGVDTAWAVGGTGSDYIMLHTTDGGNTWTRQTGVYGTWDANEVDAVNASVVWAACDMAVFRSTDAGGSWQASPTADYTLDISAVDALEAWAVRATYNGTIYHTSDGGATWAKLDQLGGADLPALYNISFATRPVPEPSTLTLCLGLFGTGTIWLRQRRRIVTRGPSETRARLPAARSLRQPGK